MLILIDYLVEAQSNKADIDSDTQLKMDLRYREKI